MRLLTLMTGGALGALALAGCNPPHPHEKALRAPAALDCPETQGDLTRKSAAADGKSCAYATDHGDQVTLQLVSLNGGTVRDALAPIEAQIKAETPAAVAPPPPAAPTTPSAAGKPANADKDRVDIDLPGIHIHGSGDGRANVDTPGVHVEAHDHDARHHGDNAVVRIDAGVGGKGVVINANDGGAQIRIDAGGSGVRAIYILASDTPGPHGFKTASYEARGPKGGPIVVAVALTKADDADDLRHDVRALLRRNVGG